MKQPLLQRWLAPIFGTLRGQLIVGVALLIAVTMALFIWYLTDRQQQMLLERQTEHAVALGNSIATSSAGWLQARDYSGLQEIIDAQSRYPDLMFAMILDQQGLVLAHTDHALLGKYLQDIPDSKRQKAMVINRSTALVDVLSPVVLAGTDIGWVRVGLGLGTTTQRLETITRSGIFRAIAAIIIGSLLVAIMGWRLTRRLYAIQNVADAIQTGKREVRVELKGSDEASKLGHAFNAMLNTLTQREKELQQHRDHLSELVEERTSELLRQQIFTEAVLNNISEGIVACDKQGNLSYFNRATRLMHGIEQEELPAERWAEHYRLLQEDSITPMPTDQIPLYRVFNEEQVRDQPMIIRHSDGSEHFMLCAGKAMYGESGEKLGAVVSMHDITAQKQSEIELIKARDNAEAANRAKSVFLANMNHELRTPLNAVLGFSQLMKRSPEVTVEQMQNLNIITRSGEHLLNLINNILDISKIESGRVELETSHLDLFHLLQDVALMMDMQAHEKELVFTLQQAPDLPRYITADTGKLRQVLLNLISNAIKYTTSGSVTLRVAKKEGAEPMRLRFEVEDTGSGIPPEDRERIFSPFVQLGGRSPTEAGSGLGLAICKQYITLMGGEIDVAEAPGNGSLFYFEVPVTAATEKAEPVASQPGRVIGVADGQPRYRLLIAEDQPENRLLLHRLLEPIGFDIREAVDGQETVAIFASWHPHLIFMDMRMPLMDGLEATRRIKADDNGTQTRIIAVTAHALEDERREILAAGCHDFIRKPYKEKEIFTALTKHLGVRFIYEEESEPATPTTPIIIVGDEVNIENLTSLPDDLLASLEHALGRIDIEAVRLLIEEIRQRDPSVANALAVLARDLQYGRMLTLVETARSNSASEEST